MDKKIKNYIVKGILSIIFFIVMLGILYASINNFIGTTTETMNNYVDTMIETKATLAEEQLKSLAEFSNAKAFLLSDNSIGVVQFNYKNTSDEITSFGNNYKIKAYQNGIELERPYFVNDEKYTNYDNINKNIKQDISIPIEQAFKLENSTDDIEIDIYYSPNVYPSNDTLVQNILIPISQDENT